MGQVNVIPQVYRNNYVKAGLNSNGEIRSLESAAGVVNVPAVYPLGGQPYPWDVPVGSKVLIDPASCLTGKNPTVCPIELINHGDVWAPNGKQILFSKFGSFASPAELLTIASGENVFFASANMPNIPSGLMYLGLGIRLKCVFYKFGADVNATTFRLRFGSSTNPTSSNILAQLFPGGAGVDLPFDITMRVTALGDAGTATFTTTSMTKLATPTAVNTGGGDYAGDRNTLFATSADAYFAFNTTGTVGAQSALVNYEISLEP